MTTPADLLTRELRRDGSRPFITWYGDNPGERVELSVATTANWVAKIAGYLDDELAIEPGEAIMVDPMLHWLTAVTLLAAWSAGAAVVFDPDSPATRVEVPLDPLGAGFSRLVAAYPDSFIPTAPSGAAELAAISPDLPADARVLWSAPLDSLGIGLGLLGPLSVGGSVVYSGADRADEIRVSERVTHWTRDAAGLGAAE